MFVKTSQHPPGVSSCCPITSYHQLWLRLFRQVVRCWTEEFLLSGPMWSGSSSWSLEASCSLLSVHQGREHTSWLPAAGGPGARCEGPGPHGAGGPGHVTKNMEENQKQSEDKSKLDIIVLRSTWTELVKALEPETLLVQLLHRTLTGEQDPRYRTPSLGALSPPGGSERHGLRPGGVDSHPAASCYYRPRERSAAAPSWSNIDLDLH